MKIKELGPEQRSGIKGFEKRPVAYSPHALQEHQCPCEVTRYETSLMPKSRLLYFLTGHIKKYLRINTFNPNKLGQGRK